MAFTTSERGRVFRTETVGDFVIGRVMELDESGKNPALIVESYHPTEKVKTTNKDGEEVEVAKSVEFILYGLDITRDYERRLKRAKAGSTAPNAACKFIYVKVASINDAGYPVFDIAWSNNKADMTAAKTENDGKCYQLHEKEREQRAKSNASGGGKPNAADDDDLPF